MTTTLRQHYNCEVVTLDEIAAATKRKAADVQAEIDELGLTVYADFAGRPSLPIVKARGLVDGSIRKDHEHAAKVAAFEAEEAAWLSERNRIRGEAKAAARAEVLARNPHAWTPPREGDIDRRGYYEDWAQEIISRRITEAVSEYERTVQRPLYNGRHPRVRLWFVSELEAPGPNAAKKREAARRGKLGRRRVREVTA